jgi:formylglycine-generating enzyme required for sulfatase activity
MNVLLIDPNEEIRKLRELVICKHFPEWQVFSTGDHTIALKWIADLPGIDLMIAEAILDGETQSFDLKKLAVSKNSKAQIIFTTRYDLKFYKEEVEGVPLLVETPISEEQWLTQLLFMVDQGQHHSRIGNALVQIDYPSPYLPQGMMVGAYQVSECMLVEKEAETYFAQQLSVNRQVALVILKPSLHRDPAMIDDFVARQKVKAALVHHRIAPLYEAGIFNGIHYYTRELPRGQSLEELRKSGKRLGEKKLLEVLNGIAEAMSYAEENNYNHYRRLNLRDICIDDQGQSSIVNIFRATGEEPRDARTEIQVLVNSLKPVVAEGKAQGVLELIKDNESWESLYKNLETQLQSIKVRSIIVKLDKEKVISTRSRRWMWIILLSALAILAVILGVSRAKKTTTKLVVSPIEMIAIEAGEFIFQNNLKRTIPKFRISQTEVTIGQYAEFLKDLKKLSNPKQFDHVQQPTEKKSHEPQDWMKYYQAALVGSKVNEQIITVDCPVFNVDWWDAYAFAKSKGFRLPTELEWEKAARGKEGFLFPWGNQWEAQKSNLGNDYTKLESVKVQEEKVIKAEDGYLYWAPVDRPQLMDVSIYGVKDMAGNVSEWTDGLSKEGEWQVHPDFPDLITPVIRGGNFSDRSDQNLLVRREISKNQGVTSTTIGFRVASSEMNQ